MTVYRRNPLIMTVLGANPGGPQFIVIDSSTGRVGYTKRATGMGTEAINSAATAARRIAQSTGRSQIVFLDLSRARVGQELNLPWVRIQGITEEVHPDGSVTRGNPARRRRAPDDAIDDEIGRQWSRLMSGVQVLMTDIPRIFRDIKLEMSAGKTLEDAVRTVGGQYRVNRNPGIGGAVVSGITAAVVGRALQSNPRRARTQRCNPAISRSWDSLKTRPRIAILEFAGFPLEQASRLATRPWDRLPPPIQTEVMKGWQENPRGRRTKTARTMRSNPRSGKKGRRTLTVEQFANWVKSKRDPAMWRAFLAKFKGYEKWTHGSRARKVTVEWVDTPGVDGLWITYDGGKQPESTYIMPKGSARKGAWKHPWDTMPDIKHDPEAGIVLTKLRGRSRITNFYHS
jgi:hypothetical protein